MKLFIEEFDSSRIKHIENQRLMRDWNELTEQTFKLLIINGIVMAGANIFYALFVNPWFLLFCLISVPIYIIAPGVRKSSFNFIVSSVVLTASFLSELIFADLSRDIACVLTLSLTFDIICFLSCTLCLIYYRIYKYLKSEKGFPDFLYSSNEKHIERFFGNNDIPEDKKIPDSKPEIVNIGYGEKKEDTLLKRKHREEDDYEPDFYLGVLVKINHGNINTYTFDGKAHLMKQWNQIKKLAFRFSHFALFTSLLGAAFNFKNPLGVTIALIITVLQFLFLGNARKNNKPGIVLYNISLLIYIFTLSFTSHEISAAFVGVACIVNVMVFIFNIPLFINFGVLTELSKQDGFPSFVKTSVDLAKDAQWEAKRKTKENKAVPATEKIIMNIGYDGEEKKPFKPFDPYSFTSDETEQ